MTRIVLPPVLRQADSASSVPYWAAQRARFGSATEGGFRERNGLRRFQHSAHALAERNSAGQHCWGHVMIAADQSRVAHTPGFSAHPVLSGPMRTASQYEVAARMKAVLPRV